MNHDGTPDLTPHRSDSRSDDSADPRNGFVVQGEKSHGEGSALGQAPFTSGRDAEWPVFGHDDGQEARVDGASRFGGAVARKGVKRPFLGPSNPIWEEDDEEFDLHAILTDRGYSTAEQISICSSLASYLRSVLKANKRKALD